MEVLEQVERQTGQTPPELAAMPQLPECATHVWFIFCQLSATRQCGMTLNPIAFAEIKAWCDLHRTRLHVWELEAITGIDNAFLQSVQSETATK